uniref:Uncharacterized protein n=1 Tax=Haptolina brevifila TaxID=156173 RepID=A0A7S2JMI1_9EUKA
MADVYASPLGTSVVQIKHVPPRPPSLDGCVHACHLASSVDIPTLTQTLSRFGELLHVGSINAASTRCTFTRHEAARAASGHMFRVEDRLGVGAYVSLEFNDRPYDDRGWCVAEEIFATECLLRVELPLMARPKAVSLSEGGEATLLRPRPRHPTDIEEAIGRATFTGSGDRKTVLQIYLTYQMRLDAASFPLTAAPL